MKSTKAGLKKDEKKLKKTNQELGGVSKEMEDIIGRFEQLLKEFNDTSDKIIDMETSEQELQSKISFATCKLDVLTKLKENVANLIRKKDEFVNITNEYSVKLLTHCVGQYWDQKEQQWYNWNVHDIAEWFKYKLNQTIESQSQLNNSNNNNNNVSIDLNCVDFGKLEANMTNDRYKGKYLCSIEPSDLTNYFEIRNDMNDENGSGSSSIVHLLCDLIEIMCEKYPMRRKKSRFSLINAPDTNNYSNNAALAVESNKENVNSNSDNTVRNPTDNDVDIDNRYLCPISKTLMKHPVLAVNGGTFEKDNIIQYWRQYGKDPITNEIMLNVDEAIGLLHDNLKLKKEIDEKFNSSETVTNDANKKQTKKQLQNSNLTEMALKGTDNSSFHLDFLDFDFDEVFLFFFGGISLQSCFPSNL